MAGLKLRDKNLIAPCGLYCGECQAFQDKRCRGCISRKGLCLKYSKICKIYDCCINERNFRFCNECDDFSCKKFKFFEDEEYDLLYKKYNWLSEVIRNLKRVEKIGIEKFLDEQVKRVKELIKCAKEKGVKHCAECKDWPCEKLKRPPLRPA